MPSKPSFTLLLLIVLLVWAIVSQVIASFSWGPESWQISEWLINYSGGFVRRGLAGSAFWHLSGITGIQANHLAIATSTICYALLTAWLLRNSTSRFPACLILSCVVMGFPAYQDSIVRKDCPGLLFLIGCLRLADGPLPSPWRPIVLNMLACTAILIHETFAFYALAALILFGNHASGVPALASAVRRFITLLPSVACFGLAIMFHGSPETSQAIHNSWLPLWAKIAPGSPVTTEPSTAIQAIGWTTEYGLSFTLGLFRTGWYQPTAWIVVFSISFALVVLFTGHKTSPPAAKSAARIRIVSILLVQLLFISPLFLLGTDYGRWIFLWVTSSIILHTCGRVAPKPIENLVGRVFAHRRFGELLEKTPVYDWYLLFFGVPILWNINNFLLASPVIRHLHKLWMAI